MSNPVDCKPEPSSAKIALLITPAPLGRLMWGYVEPIEFDPLLIGLFFLIINLCESIFLHSALSFISEGDNEGVPMLLHTKTLRARIFMRMMFGEVAVSDRRRDGPT